MDTKCRYALFAYAAHEYKAAEEWLNRQAEAGWALDGYLRFPVGLAKLVPTQRRDLRYCIELTDSGDWNDGSRLELYRDAGWEEVPIPTNQLWRLFRSLPGRNPAPLQTDPTIELERFFRKRFLKDVRAIAIAAPLLFLYLFFILTVPAGQSSWEGTLFRFLSSPYGIVILLALVTGIPLLLWQLGSELGYWLRCRRLVREGESFPTPGQKSTRRRVWLESFFLIIYLVYFVFLVLSFFDFSKIYQPDRWDQLTEKPVVMAQDLGVSDGELPYTMKEAATPFYRSFEYEDRSGGNLHGETHLAAGAPLAHFAVKNILDEYSYFSFAPVDLGFDESYLAGFGRDSSYHLLLLRQGNTVARVSGEFDWTDPDILGVLWERLQLKE